MFDDGQQLDLEAAPPRLHKTRRRKAVMLLLISGGLPTLATFLGFLGLLWWPFELLSNYRFQYALILLSVAVATLFTKRFLLFLLLCLPLALNMALIVPLYIPTPEQETVLARMAQEQQEQAVQEPEDDTPQWPDKGMAQIIRHDDKSKLLRDGLMWHVSDEPLMLMNLNMNVAERGSEHVMELINDGNADIILAQSVSEGTLKQLSMHGTPYRIHNSLPRDDGYGIALLSRVSLPPKIRITKTQIVDLTREKLGVPAIAATVQWFDRIVEVLMVHLSGPWSPSGARIYQEQLQSIAQWVNNQDHDVVVMGDFNATPWAANFSALIDRTGLVNSQIGFGIQPTWPASGGFPLGEIPVDNCLHSEQLVTVERGLGPTNGADHRPLLVKLNWLKPHLISKSEFIKNPPKPEHVPIKSKPKPKAKSKVTTTKSKRTTDKATASTKSATDTKSTVTPTTTK